MESLIQKLKTNSIITLVLGLLSLTWIIIDYFVLDTVVVEGLDKFSLEWILLIFSAAALVVFHISVFITIFYVFRVIRKVKKESKAEKDIHKKDNNVQNFEPEK